MEYFPPPKSRRASTLPVRFGERGPVTIQRRRRPQRPTPQVPRDPDDESESNRASEADLDDDKSSTHEVTRGRVRQSPDFLEQDYGRTNQSRRSRREGRLVIIDNNLNDLSSEDSDAEHSYSFSLYRPKESLADESSTEYTDQKVPATRNPTVAYGSSYHIARSRYTGEGVVGGLQQVELGEAAAEGSHLFRWVHFEDHEMILGQFLDRVTNIPGLTARQVDGIRRLLARVQRKYEKLLPDGAARALQACVTQETISGENRKKVNRETITWIAMPYFCLQAYSRDPSKSGTHPARTILQTQSSATQQKRDLQQAICHLSDTPRGHCYHITQLWSLVVGESLLVTCGRMTASALTFKGNALSFAQGPKENPPKLLVHYKRSVVWAVDVEQTWFELMLSFVEFWPRSFRLKFNGKLVTPMLWQQVTARARHSKERSHLYLELSNNPQETTKYPRTDDFHVIVFLSSELVDGNIVVNWKQIRQDLTDMGHFLGNSKTNGSYYQRCPQSTHADAHKMLQDALHPEVDEEAQDEVDERSKFFNVCETVFQFFLPLSLEGDIAYKYWGAVKSIILPQQPRSRRSRRWRDDDAREILDEGLEEIFDLVHLVRNLFSQMPSEYKARIKFPEDVVNGWLHLLTALTYRAVDSYSLWERQLRLAGKLINKGIQSALQSVQGKSLLDCSLLMPKHIITLLCGHSLRDITSHREITEAYSEYLKLIQSQVERKPFDRSHQETLVRVRQEISAIVRTLEEQRQVIVALGSSGQSYQDQSRAVSRPHEPTFVSRNDATYNSRNQVNNFSRPIELSRNHFGDYPTQPAPFYMDSFIDQDANQFKLSPTDAGGYQGLLTRDGQAFVEKRLRDFQEMESHAADLMTWNLTRIDSNKDGQERAIYMFTVVTVVFLPLSTVAGILGMNTNDIRNMDANQWLFWAVALPLVAIITFACLVASGQIYRFSRLDSTVPEPDIKGQGGAGWQLRRTRDASSGREEVFV